MAKDTWLWARAHFSWVSVFRKEEFSPKSFNSLFKSPWPELGHRVGSALQKASHIRYSSRSPTARSSSKSEHTFIHPLPPSFSTYNTDLSRSFHCLKIVGGFPLHTERSLLPTPSPSGTTLHSACVMSLLPDSSSIHCGVICKRVLDHIWSVLGFWGVFCLFICLFLGFRKQRSLNYHRWCIMWRNNQL